MSLPQGGLVSHTLSGVVRSPITFRPACFGTPIRVSSWLNCRVFERPDSHDKLIRGYMTSIVSPDMQCLRGKPISSYCLLFTSNGKQTFIGTAVVSYAVYSIFSSVTGNAHNVIYCIDENLNITARSQTSASTPIIYDVPPLFSFPSGGVSDNRNHNRNYGNGGNNENQPNIQQMVMGGTLGFASGYLVKKVSKLAALALGAAFVIIQVMDVQGYHLNLSQYWGQMEPYYLQMLDLDRDGRVTERDLRQVANNAMEFIKNTLHADMSFAIGFAVGLKYG
ncbi:9941_t:CDS:2 [Paraglomus occultum]|uniref:9941_t:CDS:1 n=1 Tax=Paraglomus occultum TaxID=144539 RepID=A0A9N9FL60_9GLOM|nr:9941_t:CDS:2 [Paraglomus occultum]